ncbi:hypothetical protein MKW98_008998, partial [Papaver atlanticum]
TISDTRGYLFDSMKVGGICEGCKSSTKYFVRVLMTGNLMLSIWLAQVAEYWYKFAGNIYKRSGFCSISLVCSQGCFSVGARHVRALFEDAKKK